jgi:S1-C subfamily serine protease
MHLGLARSAAGDTAGARDALERARELAPARADVVHNLGTVYLAMRDVVGAEEAFAAALALDPANSDTRAALDALRAVPPLTGSRQREIGAELTPATDSASGRTGLRVGGVDVGSPAHRAGLRPGDLLLRSGERVLESPDSLRKALREGKGAATVALLRRGQPLELRISLE